MYKYIKPESTNDFIISDINFLAEYVFNYAYNKILDKFKYPDFNTINLNPYIRTIYILKTAKQFIHRHLKLYNVVQIKNHNYKNKEFNEFDKLKNEIITNCKNGIKLLYYYNGNVSYNEVYKVDDIEIEINDENFNYNFIEQFAKKYLNVEELKDIETKNKIPNNMFKGQYQYDLYIKTLYKFFKNLSIYQTIISNNEIKEIKEYIKKYLIESITKNKDVKFKYSFNNEYFDDFKKYISFCGKYDLVLNKNDDELVLKIDEPNEIIEELTDEQINYYKNLKIKDILKKVKNEYIEILNINPLSLKFKNMIYNIEPFDIIYNYKVYKNVYKDL